MTSGVESPIFVCTDRQYPVFFLGAQIYVSFCLYINITTNYIAVVPEQYINNKHYSWHCSNPVDWAHMPAHMFLRLWRLWASIHFRWKSMILQNQIVSVWPRVSFFRNCSLMRHCRPPFLHPCSVQCHPVPPPWRLLLRFTRPDADVFNTGYSLALACHSLLISLLFKQVKIWIDLNPVQLPAPI